MNLIFICALCVACFLVGVVGTWVLTRYHTLWEVFSHADTPGTIQYRGVDYKIVRVK